MEPTDDRATALDILTRSGLVGMAEELSEGKYSARDSLAYALYQDWFANVGLQQSGSIDAAKAELTRLEGIYGRSLRSPINPR